MNLSQTLSSTSASHRTSKRRKLAFPPMLTMLALAGVVLLPSGYFAPLSASAAPANESQPAPSLTALTSTIPQSQIADGTIASANANARIDSNQSVISLHAAQRIFAPSLSNFVATGRTSVAVSPASQRVAKAALQTGKKAVMTPAAYSRRDASRMATGADSKQARIVRVDAPISSLPPASVKPRIIPESKAAATNEQATISALPALGSDSKVIQVQSLKLPPVSQPLPKWMQNFAVSLDQPTALPLAAGTHNDARLAQNPDAPPVSQPQSPIESSDRLPNQIEVASSTYIVLVTKVDLQTVAIADPNVADVTVVNARAILVNGKNPGVTTLVVVDRIGKIRQYQVRVVPAPGGRASDIAALIGIEGVNVRQVRDAIILEGDVSSPDEMKRATDIAAIFSEKVVNQLKLRDVLDEGAATALRIQQAIDRKDVTARVVGKTAIIDGTVANENEKFRAEQIAKAYVEDGQVLNLLRLPVITVEDVRNSMGADASQPKADPNILGLGTIGTARPQPRLVVRQVGDQIILEGIVPSQLDIDSALASASRTGLQVINRLAVAPAPPAEAALLNNVAAAIGLPNIRVRGSAKRLVLEGLAADSNSVLRAGQIARGFAEEVDNMIQTPNPTQINVEVTVVEISKSGMKDLGITSSGLTNGLSLGNIGIGRGTTTALATSIDASLQASIDKGDAQLLSNPRTTVLSGRTASFQAGGQIPIPVSANVSQGSGGTPITTVQVEFKDFGVLMDVTPVSNSDGAITLRVRTDITQLDTTTGNIQVAPGVSIPSFTRRAAVTEVTTMSGGTIVLSGLISNTLRKSIHEIPILSKIPILGKLFSSKSYQSGQTDLVIFVTPKLLPNVLPDGINAPGSVFAEGPSTVAPLKLGNAGIKTFDTIGGAGIGATAGGGAGGN